VSGRSRYLCGDAPRSNRFTDESRRSSGHFDFPSRPTYAAEMLGYDAVALARLPVDSTASFAAVANPHRIAPMTAGVTVAVRADFGDHDQRSIPPEAAALRLAYGLVYSIVTVLSTPPGSRS
jgi:hypothetical protein